MSRISARFYRHDSAFERLEWPSERAVAVLTNANSSLSSVGSGVRRSGDCDAEEEESKNNNNNHSNLMQLHLLKH